MKKIEHLLSDNPRYKRFQKPMEAARVCAAGNECVLPRGRAVTFKNGLLTVEIESPAAAANMQMESGQILECINKKLGKESVKRLRYKIGL